MWAFLETDTVVSETSMEGEFVLNHSQETVLLAPWLAGGDHTSTERILTDSNMSATVEFVTIPMVPEQFSRSAEVTVRENALEVMNLKRWETRTLENIWGGPLELLTRRLAGTALNGFAFVFLLRNINLTYKVSESNLQDPLLFNEGFKLGNLLQSDSLSMNGVELFNMI